MLNGKIKMFSKMNIYKFIRKCFNERSYLQIHNLEENSLCKRIAKITRHVYYHKTIFAQEKAFNLGESLLISNKGSDYFS